MRHYNWSVEEGMESFYNHRRKHTTSILDSKQMYKTNAILVNFKKITRNLTGQYYKNYSRSFSWNTCKLQLYLKCEKTVSMFLHHFAPVWSRHEEKLKNSMITLSPYLPDVNTATSRCRILITNRLPQIWCFSKFQGEARLKTGICNTHANHLNYARSANDWGYLSVGRPRGGGIPPLTAANDLTFLPSLCRNWSDPMFPFHRSKVSTSPQPRSPVSPKLAIKRERSP